MRKILRSTFWHTCRTYAALCVEEERRLPYMVDNTCSTRRCCGDGGADKHTLHVYVDSSSYLYPSQNFCRLACCGAIAAAAKLHLTTRQWCAAPENLL